MCTMYIYMYIYVVCYFLCSDKHRKAHIMMILHNSHILAIVQMGIYKYMCTCNNVLIVMINYM